MTDTGLETRKQRQPAWFRASGENRRAPRGAGAAEDRTFRGPGTAPGPFVLTPWERTDHAGAQGGGGRMALLKGRLFEKAGVHVGGARRTSRRNSPQQIPGAETDPRFWAAGISLIAHPRNPNVPAAHMNTRFVVTSKAGLAAGPI